MAAKSQLRSQLQLARLAPGQWAPSPPVPTDWLEDELTDLSSWPVPLRAMHQDRGPHWVLSLSGEADLFTRGLLESGLATALGMHREHLVLDVSRLGFCDAGCAQQVLAAGRTTRVTLAGARGEVKLVFDLLDAHETVPRYASVAGAISRG